VHEDMAAISRRGARQTPNRVLQILVVLIASGLLTLDWIGHGSVNLNIYGLHAAEEHGTGRNERSTPRSFVLPATPGVALAQESLTATGVYPHRVSKCVSVLRTLGYQIDGDESLLNAKVVEAIYTFQSDQHLPPTGKADELTMRALKCN
jgi:hypothetical protein